MALRALLIRCFRIVNHRDEPTAVSPDVKHNVPSDIVSIAKHGQYGVRAIDAYGRAAVGAEIAKHVEEITLHPDGRTYVASGAWVLLGGVALRMVPGARHARYGHKLSSALT